MCRACRVLWECASCRLARASGWTRDVTAAWLRVFIPPSKRQVAGKVAVALSGNILSDTIKWHVTVDDAFLWPDNALRFVFSVTYADGEDTLFGLSSIRMLRPSVEDIIQLEVGGKLQPLELTSEEIPEIPTRCNVLHVSPRDVSADGAPACAASRAVAAVRR